MTWLKDNAPAIGAIAGALLAFVAILQFVVVRPINARFDQQDKYINARFDQQDKYMNTRFDQQDKYINARFDAVDQRLDRLETEVSELRTLGERISHNTGRIDLLTEQIQAIPTPGR